MGYDLSKIKGIDFSELGYVFNVEQSDDEDIYNDNIKMFIRDNLENKDVINIIRIFVKKLAQNDKYTYKKPMWVGLVKVKDDYTFASFVIELLEYLWI